MRSRFSSRMLITAGLAGGLALGAPSLSSLAQTSTAPASPASNQPAQFAEQGSSSSEMGGGGMFGRMSRLSRLSPEDRTALLDARLAGIHAGLHLTPDQEKLWPAVESAARDASKTALDLYQKSRTAGAGQDLIERLHLASDMLIARGEAMKKIAEAAQPLYASLTDDQKRLLPMLIGAGGDRRERGGGDARRRDGDASMGEDRFGSDRWQDRSDDHGRFDRRHRGFDSGWDRERHMRSGRDRDFDDRDGGYDHGWHRGPRSRFSDREFDHGWRRHWRRGPHDDRGFDQRDRRWDSDDTE